MAVVSAGQTHGASPKVLITGAGGFVGRYLTAALTERHPGWILDAPVAPAGQISLDVTDPQAVEAWVRDSHPDIVVHLAAVAAVTSSEKDPRLAWRVNLDGTLNLVLAMQAYAPDAHMLFVSSAEVYGQSLNAGRQINEEALLQPVNPYAASKAAADILVRQAAIGGLSTTVVRPFNHTGVGQNDAFVLPNFASQVARIEAGLQPPVIWVGGLDEERDFLDVADVIDAYMLLIERRKELPKGGVFNVASGVPVRIGDLLERLLGQANVPIEVRVDPARLRPSPIQSVAGDSSRMRALGWSPRRAPSDTLAAVLQEKRLALGPAASGPA